MNRSAQKGESLEEIQGSVESLVYPGEEGFTWRVVRLKPMAGGRPVTVVGVLPPLEEGMELRVKGAWVVHPRHGRQFKAREAQVLPPSSKAGLVRYLSSGAVQGVGPKLAERIVEALGERALQIIEEDPKALLRVPGIGKSKAASVASALQAHRESREALVFLRGLGLGEALSRKVYEAYGPNTVAAIRDNPYRLVRDVFGLGFATADRMARSMGIPPESPHRIQAGLLHTLRTAAEEGHSFLPRSVLIENAAALLGLDSDLVEGSLESLAAAGEVQLLQGPCPEELGPAVYPSLLARSEAGLAGAIRRLQARRPRARFPDEARLALEEEARASGLLLEEEQRRCLQYALEEPISILTGGPGVGKTTLVLVLVRALERAEEKVRLCAPTGRAARRLAEVTGRPASTIHKLLGYNPHKRNFEHHRGNPIEADLLVVDEVSMLDVQLASQLFQALGPDTRVLLVGDADQLPSVGPGNVLGDLVSCGKIPVTRLTRIFRQGERSRIVENAHRILRGEFPETVNDPKGDFFFIREEDPSRTLETILKVVTERIPAAFGLDPVEDVQVLAPMYRGEAGADRLNQELQARLVPPGPELKRGAFTFRKGDKVLQVRNDYDRELFNGDVGRVVQVNPQERSMMIRFDDRLIPCSRNDLDQVIPAFAVSVHRSQGSEFPAVVVPLTTQHYMMLRRNLLYTAVTRGRRLVVLVGSRKALELALKRAETGERWSGLAWRLGGGEGRRG